MKRDEAMELAKNGFEELSQALAQGKSDVLTKYLDVMARFHNYSFRNTLMILMQRPDATRVAGFRQWEKLGRHVKKGEKGIGIYAPMVYCNKDESKNGGCDDKSDDAKPGKTLRGFRIVHVFDVEQTEGEPLPEFSTVDGEPGDWLSKLEAVVRDAGIELEYAENLGGAKGRSEGGKILVLAHLPASEKFCVLAHEHGHELLHKGDRRKETSKKVRETEAEAVGFVVARAVGLDARSHASDYIQLYQGDTETLEESMHFIQQASAQIIEALNRVEIVEQLESLVRQPETAELGVAR